MKETNFLNSACRYCRHYKPEGRRGGSCQMLNVPVESGWKACVLGASPFDTTFKKLEDILHLQNTLLETSLSLTYSAQPGSSIASERQKIKSKTN